MRDELREFIKFVNLALFILVIIFLARAHDGIKWAVIPAYYLSVQVGAHSL